MPANGIVLSKIPPPKSEEYRPLGRGPTPEHLVAKYSHYDGWTWVIPRLAQAGEAVVLLLRQPRLSLRICEIFNFDGSIARIPTKGTRPVKKGPIYEVVPLRPLRTREDGMNLAEHWVHKVLDGRSLKTA